MDLKARESRKLAIQLLAFISMVKNAHGNSVLFKQAAYKLAKKVGMSDGRVFFKYLSFCLQQGLCTESKQCFNTQGLRTVYKFISYKEAVRRLLGLKEAQLKHLPLHKHAGNFKAYQLRIEQDVFALGLIQQAYMSHSNFPNKQNVINEIKNISSLSVSERTTGAKRRLKKLLKQFSVADDIVDVSKANGHVDGLVSGCLHLAKTIGKSSTTAFKRFRKWSEQGSIEVQNIVHFTPCNSVYEASVLIETFQKQKVRGIHVYSRKERGIKTIVGKKVIGFSSVKFQYGTLCDDSSSLTFSK